MSEKVNAWVCEFCPRKKKRFASAGNANRHETPEWLVEPIKEVIRAGVELAFVRADLTSADADNADKLDMFEVADDAANAAFGEETCAEEPVPEIKRLVAALLTAIERATQEKWVSVGERLPEDPGHYFVFWACVGVGSSVTICDFDEYGNDGKLYWEDDSIAAAITHWQPLPEPPEVKK